MTTKQLSPGHPFLKHCCFSSRIRQLFPCWGHLHTAKRKARMTEDNALHIGSSKEGILSTPDVHSYIPGIPPSPHAGLWSIFMRTASRPLCPKYSSQQHSPLQKGCVLAQGQHDLHLQIPFLLWTVAGNTRQHVNQSMLEEQSCKPVRKRRTASYISNMTSLPLPKPPIQTTLEEVSVLEWTVRNRETVAANWHLLNFSLTLEVMYTWMWLFCTRLEYWE